MDPPKEINTYLPGKTDWPAEFLERGVFSFHYYGEYYGYYVILWHDPRKSVKIQAGLARCILKDCIHRI